MNNPSTSVTGRSTGWQDLCCSRCIIIILTAIALGLTFNALSPNGIPLVKKAPSMTND